MKRRTLVVTGSTLGTAFLAGCLSDEEAPEPTNGDDDPGDDNGDDPDGETGDAETAEEDGESRQPDFPAYELPAYGEWPPVEPRTRDFVLAGHMNAHYLHEADDDDDTEADDEPLDAEDVLLTMPFFGGITTLLWFSLGLWEYPWESTLGSADEPEGMETTAFTMTEGTFVFHGEYDDELFADEYADEFDEREVGAFTVFEGRDGEATEELAYAASNDTVVAAIAPEGVTGHDTIVGNLTNAVENHESASGRILDDEDGRWLFETTGPADLATCFWGVEGMEPEHLDFGDEDDSDEETETIAENPVFENVDSFVSTLALPEVDGGVGGDMAAARFAAIYPEGEVPSEDELREGLLSDESAAEADVHVTSGDDRAHVEVQTTVEEIE